MSKTAKKPVTEPVVVPIEESTEHKKEVELIGSVITDRAIAPAETFSKLTRGQIELIKNTVAKGATDDELKLFIQVCAGARLNPFLRQAHLVPFWDSKAGEERRTIVIGIDGFRAIAEDGGGYAGSDDAVFDGEAIVKIPKWEGRGKEARIVGHEEHKVPAKATVTVHKVVQGHRYPFTASVWWAEVYPGEKKGGQWHVRPRAMISKCAEALALRKGFPKLLSGMYIPEEMDRAMQEGAEDDRMQKGYEKVMTLVQRATKKQLEDLVDKMTDSDKYTAEQKAAFQAAANTRMDQLIAQEEKPV